MQTHQEVERKLRRRLAELEHKVVSGKEDLRHSDTPLEQDFAEQATAAESDEVKDALDTAMRKEHAEILAVLQRMKLGGYGHCQQCGDEIPEQRLKAVPFARLCVACASGQ